MQKSLVKLKQDFIITTADKASNNYVFMCKKFYISVICKELGITVQDDGVLRALGNTVYKTCVADAASIMRLHETLSNKYNLAISTDNKVLPMLFAIPKLHKNPCKFRFIAGAKRSSIKPISVLLQGILLHFAKHFNNYCHRVKSNSSMQLKWSINNSQQAISKLNQAKKTGPLNFTVCDFSTLYTNLPHDIICSYMFQLIDLCFNNAHMEYLALSYHKDQSINKVWYCSGSTHNSAKLVLHKNEVKCLLTEVVEQTYIRFADQIFMQILGVPMGNNSAPQLADLTLTMMEYNFLKSTVNRPITSDLQYVSRYIDDLLIPNCPLFRNVSQNIYDKSLNLEFICEGSSKCDYLDLSIEQKNRLHISVYNKTDAFPFYVERYGYIDSNVPSSIHYVVFESQILRIAQICTDRLAFVTKAQELVAIFIFRNFSTSQLINTFYRAGTRHSSIFVKFNVFSKIDMCVLANSVFI